MLPAEGRAAELPDHLAGSSIDGHDPREVPVAQVDVSVRPDRDSVGVAPLTAAIHRPWNDVRGRVEVLPVPPLPDHITAQGDLLQVVAIDSPGPLGAGETTLDASRYVIGKGSAAEQENVAIRKSHSIVMVVWVPNLPKDVAVPVRFERNSCL